MTGGVTVRIFRLIETVAAEAIRDGSERITADSFAVANLVLPLVAMTRQGDRRLQRRIAG